MHRHPGGVDLAEPGQRGVHLGARLAADRPAHDDHVGEREPVLHRRGDHPRVAADQAGPRRLGPGLLRGRGQRVRAHVADLPGARRAGQLHQLVADRDHRHPRLGVHQHLVPPGRGEQRHLGRADHPVPAHGQVTRLHVLADPAHEGRRRHALLDHQAGAAGVGVARPGPRRRPASAAARRRRPAPPGPAAAAAAAGIRPGSRRRPAATPASPRRAPIRSTLRTA